VPVSSVAGRMRDGFITLLSARMLGRTYEGQNCSVAKALELVGERWTVLVLRDVFLGRRRFDELADRLGIARNVLTARLARLVEEGVLERVAYQRRPERFEYHLTEKGLDLWPVLVSLMKFGDRHYALDGPPLLLVHRDCGGLADDRRICDRCDAHLTARDVRAEPGPGSRLAGGSPPLPRAPAPRRGPG
jgi:DNA-binding HxlR family transcriptional regulator